MDGNTVLRNTLSMIGRVGEHHPFLRPLNAAMALAFFSKTDLVLDRPAIRDLAANIDGIWESFSDISDCAILEFLNPFLLRVILQLFADLQSLKIFLEF